MILANETQKSGRNYFKERREAQNFLLREGLMDKDCWRMNTQGELTFYPPKPKGMIIGNSEREIG